MMVRPELTAQGINDRPTEHPAGAELHPATGPSVEELGLHPGRVKHRRRRGGAVLVFSTRMDPFFGNKVIARKDHDV